MRSWPCSSLVRMFLSGFLSVTLIHVVKSDQTIYRGVDGCSTDYRFPGDVNVTTIVTSPFECLRKCSRYEWCDSANVCAVVSNQDLLKCENMVGTDNGTCDSLQEEPGCWYLKKINPRCYNGGTYVESSSSCTCVFGFTGDLCERYYWDCSEAFQKTKVGRGVVSLVIQPRGSPHPFTVSCLLDYGGYTYIEKRKADCPEISFNRTWEELRYTVGDPSCSYWLGLEYIHQLTAQAEYLLDIFIAGTNSYDGQPLYTNFKIGNEASGYKLNYDTYKTHPNPADDGFAVEGINGPNGHPFATLDRPDSGGCVFSEGAAWWYGPACPGINLHLPLYTGSPFKHATWVDGGSSVDITTFVVQIYTLW